MLQLDKLHIYSYYINSNIGVVINMFCSFFGHHDYGLDSEFVLEEEVEKLILGCDVDVFYVGNKGRFDRSVHRVLTKMKKKYSFIKVFLVLDSLEPIKNEDEREYLESLKKFEFLLPDGIENVPRRYRMSYRNKWMIKECDYAIIYYLYPGTNTQRHLISLTKAHKNVINVAEIIN